MKEKILQETKIKMEKTIEHFKEDLRSIRTGRATPSLVENIEIDYYNTATPLIQVAAITTPDPKTILIQPWDKTSLSQIEKAISSSELGLSASNDGNSIIVKLPPLTEENREKLVRIVKEKCEEAKVSLRNERHASWDLVKKAESAKEISEDEMYKAKEELDELIDINEKEIEKQAQSKEEEIKEI